MIELINLGLLIINIIIITIIIILYMRINNIVSELSDKYSNQKDMVIDILKS